MTGFTTRLTQLNEHGIRVRRVSSTIEGKEGVKCLLDATFNQFNKEPYKLPNGWRQISINIDINIDKTQVTITKNYEELISQHDEPIL